MMQTMNFSVGDIVRADYSWDENARSSCAIQKNDILTLLQVRQCIDNKHVIQAFVANASRGGFRTIHLHNSALHKSYVTLLSSVNQECNNAQDF